MAGDVDIKFTRNKSDNMLVKSQSLQNMLACGVDLDTAFNVCGLFSDSTDVVNKSVAFFGEDFWKPKKAEVATPTDNISDNEQTVNPAVNGNEKLGRLLIDVNQVQSHNQKAGVDC